jgi:serine/threonine protein kinase/HEAT repeat protein
MSHDQPGGGNKKNDKTLMGFGMIPDPKPAPVPDASPPRVVEPTVRAIPGEGVGASHPIDPGAAVKATVLTPGSVARPSSAADPFVGRELCGYILHEKLAEGGMGMVYVGEHAKIGRKGAIKILKPEYCQSEEVAQRFYQEARAVNAIQHEHIVDVYDFGRDPDGRVFFVMELLQGEPLAARLKRGPLRWSEAYPILDQTLRALKAAHDKGFVHRDLKPDNLFLQKQDDGAVRVKLLDFGIAKLVGMDNAQEKLTKTGAIIGTPHYMSPEQINGAASVDHRTDIYSMGIILYELFAGVPPFAGETLAAIMTGHLFTEAPRLHAVPKDLGVPRPVAEIIDRMLVKDPKDRYDSVSDVLSDLKDVHQNVEPTLAKRFLHERPKKATAAMTAALAAPSPQQKKSWTVPVVLVAALGAAAAVYLVMKGDKEALPATAPRIVAPEPPPPPPAEKPLDYEQIRKDAQLTLRSALKEAEPKTRVQGASAVAHVKDEASVPALSDLVLQDPDEEVRGHAASALGELGVRAALSTLAKESKQASPVLKVWLCAAEARLGDKAARKKLVGYAKEKDLGIAFKAALALADVSPTGDKEAISVLTGLAAREAELNAIAPYAGAVLLTKLAGLRYPKARAILYTTLEATDEGARLATAEGLARIGDDAGKKILQEVLANEASPNRIVAAVTLIALGDYSGFELLEQKLADQDPQVRRLAAQGLGEIGERTSVKGLVVILADKDWGARISAGVALLAILGLDPKVLVSASVNWAESALASDDWVVRKSAAGVIGDVPEAKAIPLLALAIVDKDAEVRRAAARSARKLKSAEAAQQILAVVKTETDPLAKEEQVKSLGSIGSPVAKDTLLELQADPGRVGIFASGSLIAVGDLSGKDRLDLAIVDEKVDLRIAAVESATLANNPIVVPTLEKGLSDQVFDVRFASAAALSGYHAEKDKAQPVLEEGLAKKDVGVKARAQASLRRYGVTPAGKSPREMLDSADPAERLAAIAVISEMPWDDAAPLLRKAVADPDLDVRRTAVDALAPFAQAHKEEVTKTYKGLRSDDDPVTRTKANVQLARLVPPVPTTETAARPEEPARPTVDIAPVLALASEAKDSLAQAQAARAKVKEKATVIDELTRKPAKDDADVKVVEDLAHALEKERQDVDAARARTEEAAQKTERAADGLKASAGNAMVPPEMLLQVNEAKAAAREAAKAAEEAKKLSDSAAEKAETYTKAETGDADMFLSAADAEIATGAYADAKRDLDKAAKLYQKAGEKNPAMAFSYARLYDKMAARERNQATQLELLKKAKQSYDAFAKTGSGKRVAQAQERSEEIAEEIKELGGAAP